MTTIAEKLQSIGVDIPKDAVSYHTTRKGTVHWMLPASSKVAKASAPTEQTTIHWCRMSTDQAHAAPEALDAGQFFDAPLGDDQLDEMLKFGIAGSFGWTLSDQFHGIERRKD